MKTKKDDEIPSIEIDNLPYALTPEQEADLKIAIEETYHEENLITHKEALKELARWLSQ